MSEDSSSLPIGTIVLVVTFLGLSGFLLTLMIAETPQMFTSSEEYRLPEVPEQFEGIDVLKYAETTNDTVPHYGTNDISSGGWNLEIAVTVVNPHIRVNRGERWSFIEWGWHSLKFRDYKGKDVSSYVYFGVPVLPFETIDLYFDATENASRFIAYDSVMQLDIYFNYDANTYANSSNAWENNALYYMVGVEWDEINTGTGIWNIMSMLLFFSLPTIPYPLNYIIPLPIWIAVITLIAVVVIRIIELLKPLS